MRVFVLPEVPSAPVDSIKRKADLNRVKNNPPRLHRLLRLSHVARKNIQTRENKFWCKVNKISKSSFPVGVGVNFNKVYVFIYDSML